MGVPCFIKEEEDICRPPNEQVTQLWLEIEMYAGPLPVFEDITLKPIAECMDYLYYIV